MTQRLSAAEVLALNREWVQHWKRYGPILEKIKRDELRSKTDAQCLAEFIDLCNGPRYDHPDNGLGLVEMQRWLAKLRK